MNVIPAAGTLPWRVRDGRLEVALVHRPRYDDWSWAKGKLDPGEPWQVAAARETTEESGLEVRLGRPLPEARYVVLTRSGEPQDKVVRYWAARVTGGHGRTEHEVDEVAWLGHQDAHDRLDYARDRDQLRALVRAHAEQALDTWPLIVLRHARALPRESYPGDDDRERPLDERGRTQAARLVPLLATYAPEVVVSSPSVRCLQTIDPYAAWAGVRVHAKKGFSEEGHAARPAKAAAHVTRILERGRPTVVCGHGPVLPAILEAVATRVATVMTDGLTKDGLAKGELAVCHVAGTGEDARVVAVETATA